MKFASEIIVDLTLKEFIKKFDNAENMKHWHRGLVSIEHVSGNPGMVGAKMKLNYLIENRKMAIIETVTHQNFPYAFNGIYSTKGIDNIQENHFEEISNGSTKWTSISEFMPLSFSMRAMLWVMPKSFKNQSHRYMNDFKNFAERDISIYHEKA